MDRPALARGAAIRATGMGEAGSGPGDGQGQGRGQAAKAKSPGRVAAAFRSSVQRTMEWMDVHADGGDRGYAR